MNEESFNLSVRKFLKQFGVGAQREIEQAVLHALENGTLAGNEELPASATLKLGRLNLEFTVDGQITLA